MVDAQARVRDTRPRQWKSEVLSSTPSAAAVLSISSWIQFGFSLDSVWIQFEFNLDRIIRTVFVPEVVIVQVPAQGRSEAILGFGQIRRICEDIAPR